MIKTLIEIEATLDTNGNSYSLLEHVAKSAQCWVEIKEGR